MAASKCPICKQESGKRPDNVFFPFCSDRCKTLDLAKWLGGDYAIPSRDEDEGDGEGAGGGQTIH